MVSNINFDTAAVLRREARALDCTVRPMGPLLCRVQLQSQSADSQVTPESQIPRMDPAAHEDSMIAKVKENHCRSSATNNCPSGLELPQRFQDMQSAEISFPGRTTYGAGELKCQPISLVMRMEMRLSAKTKPVQIYGLSALDSVMMGSLQTSEVLHDQTEPLKDIRIGPGIEDCLRLALTPSRPTKREVQQSGNRQTYF